MIRTIVVTCALTSSLYLATAHGDDQPAPEPVWKADLSVKDRNGRTPVSWVGFSPDGRQLCSRSESSFDFPNVEYDVQLWDVATKRSRSLLIGERGEVYSSATACAFASNSLLVDGRQFVEILANEPKKPKVKKWFQSAGEPIGVWMVGKVEVLAAFLLPWRPSGGFPLAGGIETEEVSLIRGTLSGKETLRGSLRTRPCARMAVNWNGTKLALAQKPEGRGPASLTLYEIEAGKDLKLKQLAEAKVAHAGSIHSMHFSPDGTTLATTGDEGTLGLWKTEKPPKDWKPYASAALPGGWQLPFWCSAFRPDGKIVAFGTSKRTGTGVGLVDVRTGKLLRHFETGTTVISLAFSPDGKLLATGGFEGILHLWDADQILTGGLSE